MSRPSLVRLEEVASLPNLAAAFWRAAQGKRRRLEVRRFERHLDRELAILSREISDLSVQPGRMRVFQIHDPKLRTIHAPEFRDRVLHHALMALVAPILERSLVEDTFACRPRKGTLAAVRRAQAHVRSFPCFAKLDVRSYFASIHHEALRGLLQRRLRGHGVLALLGRIVASHEASPGRGLPIGALTSQHLANLYLGGLDRAILGRGGLGLVRYMDDVVVWGRSRSAVLEAAAAAEVYAREELRLTVKPGWQVQPSAGGVPLCGFRVFADRLLLSRRRQRRYRRPRRRCEAAHGLGLLDAGDLQSAYSSALAITAHAAALAWRRGELERRPAPDV